MSKWSKKSRNSSEIFLWYCKGQGQGNKKCSVSSIPSFVGHIGFMVSLKLCLNLRDIVLRNLYHRSCVPRKLCSVCNCCCGGAVDSVISVCTQLHRSGFNLDFETSFESI